MSYPREKLKNFIDVLSGFAFKSKDFTSAGVPVIKIKNVTPPTVTLDDLSYVSKEIAQAQNRFLLNYDDVLIALTGSHINQMASVVGRVARVRHQTPSLLNQRVGKITVINPDEMDLDYVYYYLSQDLIKIQLASKAGGAANQANISPSDVKNLDIPFPDIDVQRRISGILSAYDNLIENNQKQIKLLEEAARRLYKEWFVDLRFPGYEDTPIVDGVPEGWERLPVGELIEKIPRTTQIMASEYGKEGPIPIIDQSREFIAGYTDNHASLVNVGKPVIVFGDHTRILKYIQFPFAKGADGTQLIVSNTDRMPQSLFYCSLVGVDLSNYHYARHFKYLKAEELLVPTQVIAEAFDHFVSPMFSKIQRLRDINKAATNARDRLLPKLMSGEIEV